jgi:hypothetical protein
MSIFFRVAARSRLDFEASYRSASASSIGVARGPGSQAESYL